MALVTLAVRLKQARLAAGFATAKDAALKHGWNENTYRATENGRRQPGRDMALTYAQAFGVDLDWLLSGIGSPHPDGRRQIPVYRLLTIEAPLGANIRAILRNTEKRGSILPLEDENFSPGTFAIVLEDNSMLPPTSGVPQSLHPGDKVWIDPDLKWRPGDVVLARQGTKPIVRRITIEKESHNGTPDIIKLSPLNPDFAPHLDTPACILGVVVGFSRHYRRES